MVTFHVMNETWKPVLDYEGIYEVSDLGRVRRVRGGKGAKVGALLRPTPFGRYLVVRLSDLPGKRKTVTRNVHELVLEAFRGVRPVAGQECRHLNDLPRDNRLPNLEWGTKSENALDRSRNGCHGKPLDRHKARVICHLALRARLSQRTIGRWFGVSAVVVSHVKRGKLWGWATEDIRHSTST